ncbi:structural maintenance of chromosomes protein [Anaeramoeba flamelloides]|uniref:Structural maintenance of chromosomes protein n=1 Tax=Anaeramoeba flamelloides TaxID=1746091 RepID=A0ABQ8Y8N6_9EUKA|nr:structural maintenance of chromosomes protein [Anaeramoeba flamelloides]
MSVKSPIKRRRQFSPPNLNELIQANYQINGDNNYKIPRRLKCGFDQFPKLNTIFEKAPQQHNCASESIRRTKIQNKHFKNQLKKKDQTIEALIEKLQKTQLLVEKLSRHTKQQDLESYRSNITTVNLIDEVNKWKKQSLSNSIQKRLQYKKKKALEKQIGQFKEEYSQFLFEFRKAKEENRNLKSQNEQLRKKLNKKTKKLYYD